ncbi:MAG: ABC transporter permease subunit, partial [Firmicutes bacterium]|nr:ABC transporter permease subunit [Bacillota bacterium]
MNRTLIAKELRELRWKLLVGFLALLGAALLMILMYEKIQLVLPEDTSQLPPFVTPEMLESLGDYTAAMWSNFNDKNIPQIGTLLAIVLGIGLLAPEIESGTITLLLTNGVCRKRVFWIKTTLAVVTLIVLPMVVTVLIGPFSRAFGYSLRHLRQIPATLVASLGLAFVMAVSRFISLLVKERIWSGIACAILFGLWSVLG